MYIIYLSEFWEMDPNHTFIFDYISCYHLNSSILPLILYGLQNLSYLKYQRNTLEIQLHHIKYIKKYNILCVIWIHYAKFGHIQCICDCSIFYIFFTGMTASATRLLFSCALIHIIQYIPGLAAGWLRQWE